MSVTFHDPTAPTTAAHRLWTEGLRRKEVNVDRLKQFYSDPLGFTKWAWRWGLPGPLERFTGPDKWQEEFMIDLGEQVKQRNFNGRDPVTPIKMTASSGHGAGKTSLAAWINTWLLSTRPMAQGTVTANTYTQLETKTWAAMQHWFKTSRVAGDFIIGGGGIRHRVHNKSWMCTPQTCREENSEAFAGQHAASSSSYYLVDEGSAVPDKIYEVAELGGLTDGEPFLLVFGNCTRNSGKFFRVNFGSEKEFWNHRTVDARTCSMPNKTVHDEILKQYGEDSDQFRVRVLGLPPQASDIQFIDNKRVFDAQRRKPEVIRDEPLVAGVDCARGGSDKVVIRFRQGDDARSIKAIKIPGEQVRDSMLLVAKLSDLAVQDFGEGDRKRRVDAWFVDSGNMGGPIVDRLHQLGFKNFIEVNFAGQCPDPLHYANMRVWMWSKMRDHLGTRLAIDSDQELEIDLTGPGIHHDRSNRILLESKEDMQRRGLASQDDGDSLALSYAQTVTALSIKEKKATAWARGVVGKNDLPF